MPNDVLLSSWLSAPSNSHHSTAVIRANATLSPAPPDTTTLRTLMLNKSPASEMLQFVKFDLMTETTAAPDTATAPPRTATLIMLAPLAEHFKKLQEEMFTDE
jgi:hypothetical protein